MEVNILPDLFLNIVDKVNFYWHLYIISIIAVVGWLLSLKHPMRWQLKSISYGSHWWSVIVIHSCVDTIMLIAIWSNKVADSIRIRGKLKE